MAHLSDDVLTGGWQLIRDDGRPAVHEDRGRASFVSAEEPGVLVEVVITLDGTVVGLHVHGVDVPIGNRLVRRIPLNELALATRARVRRFVEGVTLALGDYLEHNPDADSAAMVTAYVDKKTGQLSALSGHPRRPGRRPQPGRREFYARLAVLYEVMTARGQTVEDVAKAMGITRDSARQAIYEARSDRWGFLSKTTRGSRTGGVASREAWDITRAALARAGYEEDDTDGDD